MKMPWGGLQAEAIGAWDELAAAVRKAPGHRDHQPRDPGDRLALAGRSGRWSRSATAAGTEVHVILSVRDLVRQIPAEWQENVKHRAGLSYRDFLTRIQDPERASRIGSWFWGVQEIPDILNRWGHDLPPEHVHLVTVPPPGRAGPALEAVQHGVRARRPRPRPRGRAGQPVARRPRDRADPPDQPQGQQGPAPARLPAAGPRAARPPDAVAAHASPRLALPPDVHPWVQELSQSWVEEIRRRGYDVVGELERPGRRPAGRRTTPTRTAPRSGRSPRPVSTRSRRCCSTTPGCATRRSGCTASCTRRTSRWSGPTCGRRTGCARRSCAGWRAACPARALLKVYRAARGRSSRSA